ncbi:MAG TPA: ABC transporter substrate-binding protein [Candidatus Binatia bacterium]|nr:ABC transporter substrate-binding protein [Candidatus Binatia bacterium]
MRRGAVEIILVLALGCLVAPHIAAAQQPGKVHRIGVLTFTSFAPAIEELQQGLRELGYVEGRNLILEVRSAEGRRERLPDLATELVQLPVDLMVAHTTTAVVAAKRATTTLPIVAAVMSDPIEVGIVESLAHPGGNITGSFVSRSALQAKRLELLKEALPGVTRVAIFLEQGMLKALARTAQELGVELQPAEVRGPDDIERALSAIVHGQAEALVVSDGSLFGMHAKRIGDFIVEQRLPTIGASRGYLMAYAVSGDHLWRRAAVFVDKILKGARPGDLPMERAAQFELMIDLKVAQELGLTIPESLLLRADKVFPVSGVPLPDRLRIVPPDRRVAPELAAFSGKWFGAWEGDVQGEHILVVETIDPPHALVIYAWGNSTGGAGTVHPQRLESDWLRLRGHFVEGTLQMSLPGGATLICRLQPDGTLAATQTWRGAVSRATMTRAPE